MGKYEKEKVKAIKKPKRKRHRVISGQVIIITVVLLFVFITNVYSRLESITPVETDILYTDFTAMMERGEIVSATVINETDFFYAHTSNGRVLKIANPKYPDFKKDLMLAGIDVSVQRSDIGAVVASFLFSLPLYLLFILVALFLVNLLSGVSDTMFSNVKKEKTVTFDKVAGLSEVKEELRFAVDILRNNDIVIEAGLRGVKGVMLYGPPGTGKTLIARAIAGEAGVPFICASGSDFHDKYVGVGATRVRQIYQKAILNAPCVVFIDEIDALGKKRSYGSEVNAVFSGTLNTLLQRMDGLQSKDGILFIGATNMMEVLDPALLRPGRFDRQVYVGPPSTKEDRDEIINVHLENKKLADNVTIDDISKFFFGMTGAEIEGSLNEAGIESMRKGRNGVISVEDIDSALMKLITKGTISARFSDKERELTAVHEAGHAIVSLHCGKKLAKVSIVAYGHTGGATMLDYSDNTSVSKIKLKSELENEIKILLGGLCAEEVIYGEHSSGGSNDLLKVTEQLTTMVKNYGMGSNLLVANQDSLTSDQSYLDDANKTALALKQEVITILKEKKDDLLSMKEELLQKEVIYF